MISVVDDFRTLDTALNIKPFVGLQSNKQTNKHVNCTLPHFLLTDDLIFDKTKKALETLDIDGNICKEAVIR